MLLMPLVLHVVSLCGCSLDYKCFCLHLCVWSQPDCCSGGPGKMENKPILHFTQSNNDHALL